MITVFSMKLCSDPTVKLFPWQQQLLGEISLPSTDDQKIIWYFDPSGNGTTFFMNFLHKHNNSDFTFIATPHQVGNMIHSFAKTTRENPSLVVFDFKDQEKISSLEYEGIECSKNGLFPSLKTCKKQAETFKFNSPHVVIFSRNFPNARLISLKRLDLRLLKDKESFHLPKLV